MYAAIAHINKIAKLQLSNKFEEENEDSDEEGLGSPTKTLRSESTTIGSTESGVSSASSSGLAPLDERTCGL